MVMDLIQPAAINTTNCVVDKRIPSSQSLNVWIKTRIFPAALRICQIITTILTSGTSLHLKVSTRRFRMFVMI